MKQFASFLFIFTLSIACRVTAEEVALAGAETGKWTMDYDAALKLANEKQLPLLLNFTGSDWCGWCKLMDKNVFAGEAWKTFAKDNAVLVTLDFPRDPLKVPQDYLARNRELQKKFGVQGYPTYVVLDSDGETVLGQLGAGQDKTPESFVTEFKNTARFSAASIKAYSEANPDKAAAFKAAIEDKKKVEAELRAWIGTRPEQNEANNKIFSDFKKRMEAAAEKLDEFQ
ncbi:MAG: thioredoxin family protein [Verrucomicrobiales bacterium]|nr:thioredoxin family protein [Verrucomicrobiales bacterium]